ncbi:hypothetical protein ACEPPN_005282 [Leptodophora sp. 'Broadleaf-Isolate-01']
MASTGGNNVPSSNGIPGLNSNPNLRIKAIRFKTSTSVPASNTMTTSTTALFQSSSYGSLGGPSTIQGTIDMIEEIDKIETTLDTSASFTLFPKLPLELRYKIWKDSFAGRHVGVTVGTVRGEPKRYRIGSPQEPPFTLEVCTESRVETLRHYVVIPAMPIPSRMVLPSAAKQVIHPFFFNPKVDTLYTESALFYHYPIRVAFRRWFKNIIKINPTVFRNIVTLEIREVDFEKLEMYGRDADKLKVLHGPLLMFPGLKIVRYTALAIKSHWLDRPDGSRLVIHEPYPCEARDKYKKGIDSWVVKNEKRFTSGKAPVVRVRWMLPLSEEPLSSWTLVEEDHSRR